MAIRDVTFGLLLLALVGCAESPPGEPAKPQRAGQPMDPAKTAARIASMQANSMLGDQESAQRDAEVLSQDMLRSMKLADPARRIDRESARQVASQVAGVRSVVWIDRENLLAIVEHNEQRSYSTIDGICLALEPLGDTLGVVVNLQSGAAKNGDELEILSRNCQLQPGDRALLQRNRQVDVVDPNIRAQHRANQARTQRTHDPAEQAENARILEAGTPEM